MAFEQIKLPYAFDALEPNIDAQTMELHYGKHHAGYTSKLNAAVEGTDFAGKSIEDIFSSIGSAPKGVRNNGGGFYNHNLFWEVMAPGKGGEPTGALAEAINAKFGSFAAFKEEFETAAKTQFGSGWAWLSVGASGDLVVSSTPNQDNPLMDIAEVKGTPILGLDVWEHAYYLKYQNLRPSYVSAFWNVVNWDKVSEKFAAAKA